MDGLRWALTALVPVMIMGLAGGALLTDGAPQNTTITTVPYTITAPGTYKLATDLVYEADSESAITVRADGVVIDFDGHKLWSPGHPATKAVGIAAEQQSYITIQNGRIEGFYFAIRLMGTNRRGHHVRSMALVNNWYVGLFVDGASSVIAECRIENTGGCNLRGCTTPLGMHVAGPECAVLDNQVIGFVRYPGLTQEIVALAMDEAPGALVAGNVFAQEEYLDNSWGLWVNSPADDFSTVVDVQRNYFANFECGAAFAYSEGRMKENKYYNVPTKWHASVPNRAFDLGGNSTLSAPEHSQLSNQFTHHVPVHVR